MAGRIVVTARSARVEVRADAEAIVVRGAGFTTGSDGVVTVDAGHSKVEIACPPGTDLVIGTDSGRVRATGVLGDTRIATASGRVEVERARSLDVRTSSGRVDVREVDGLVRVSTHSGRVTVGAAGAVDVSVRSGRVTVTECGNARVHALSGSVAVGAHAGADVDLCTTSGRIDLTLPTGCCPSTEVEVRTGRVDVACPVGQDARVAVKSVSGRVTVGWRSA